MDEKGEMYAAPDEQVPVKDKERLAQFFEDAADEMAARQDQFYAVEGELQDSIVLRPIPGVTSVLELGPGRFVVKPPSSRGCWLDAVSFTVPEGGVRYWEGATVTGEPDGAPLRDRQAQTYPYEEGDTIVLGPEIFVSKDEAVICWKGRNYVTQERFIALAGEAKEKKNAVEQMYEQVHGERNELKAMVERLINVTRYSGAAIVRQEALALIERCGS